jgi:hypothetical protein
MVLYLDDGWGTHLKDRLEKTELILSIKSLTLSSGTFMEWSSQFHNNPNHSKDLQGVQTDFSLLTTNPAKLSLKIRR